MLCRTASSTRATRVARGTESASFAAGSPASDALSVPRATRVARVLEAVRHSIQADGEAREVAS